METVDGLAFIGRNPLDTENVYIATGDSGMGMTHGTIAGMLLTDLILGRENPGRSSTIPAASHAARAGGVREEKLNVAAQYADWLTAGDVESADEIAKDAGAVMRRGLRKVAVYRDAPATCTNARPSARTSAASWSGTAEKTWDCPCHGSRFDKFGAVINGPANVGLTRI